MPFVSQDAMHRPYDRGSPDSLRPHYHCVLHLSQQPHLQLPPRRRGQEQGRLPQRGHEVPVCPCRLAPPPLTSNQILYGCGSVSPSPSGTNDGASGSAVAGPASPFLSLLFCVLVAEGGADCTHAFREVLLELRLLSLQLLMLAPPTQADFERVCMGLASKCHVEGGTHSHVEGGTHSQVEACTRRLAASVVRVLEVQFLRCGECSEKKLRTESFASAVVPGLVSHVCS